MVSPGTNKLTHWGRVMHICVSNQTIIGSDNGLSPGRRQAIIWTNAGILLTWPLGIKFSEIFIEIDIFSVNKMHLKMSSGKRRPSCLGLNVLSTPFTVAQWGNKTTQILAIIVSGNGLVPYGTKPLPETMLTYQWCDLKAVGSNSKV